MKETNLKNYLKTGALCFGLSLLMWNCRYQDDSVARETVREKKIRIVSFDHFKDAVIRDESFTAMRQYFYKGPVPDSGPEFFKASENSVILTDKIIKIVQEEALSWLGLKDATIVAWQNLSDEEKSSINDILAQIKNTFPNGCN